MTPRALDCPRCGGDGAWTPFDACPSCMGTGRYRPYTGVGSRGTPPDVLATMRAMARKLAGHGFTLRSGGARGADQAFEQGCDRGHGPKEVYLTAGEGWDPAEALEVAAGVHPAWGLLSEHARLLHARNVHQVLGARLDRPSMFLVCWTPDGRATGGTRTAITLAKREGVPCFNLVGPWTLKQIVEVVKRRRGGGAEGRRV